MTMTKKEQKLFQLALMQLMVMLIGFITVKGVNGQEAILLPMQFEKIYPKHK